MQTINIKTLIETIRDCESNVNLLEDGFKALGADKIAIIRQSFPNQIGEGLMGFIHAVLPTDGYGEFEKYFNNLYAAKIHPFWMDVEFETADTALKATMAYLGITPDTIFTSEKQMANVLEKIIANKISFRLDWWDTDIRYPDHQSGRLIIKETDLKLTAHISQGKPSINKRDITCEFIKDIDSLKNFNIEHLEISGVKKISGNFERCEDHEADLWTIYGRYIENDTMLSIALCDCNSRQNAEQIQYLMEVLISQWKGPRHQHYCII